MKNIRIFIGKLSVFWWSNFQFSIYLNKHVFVMLEVALQGASFEYPKRMFVSLGFCFCLFFFFAFFLYLMEK